MTIVRPSIVFGPSVDNYIVRAFDNNPFVPILDGVDEEFQLVHEDDVVSALIALLDGKHAGAFNLAGDGLLTWGRAAELVGKKTRNISLKTMKRVNNAMWKLRVPRTEAPAGNLDFIRYPWVVSTEKLKSTAGWQPKYDTLETFKITMRAKRISRRRPPPFRRPQRLSHSARHALTFSARAHSSVGRAPPRQGGGRWFEPSCAHRRESPSDRVRSRQRHVPAGTDAVHRVSAGGRSRSASGQIGRRLVASW